MGRDGLQLRDPLRGKAGVFPEGIGFAGQRQGQEIFAHCLQLLGCLAATRVHGRQAGLTIQAREAVKLPLHIKGFGKVGPDAFAAGADAPAVEVVEAGEGRATQFITVVFRRQWAGRAT